jgi:uncharacterized protein YfdQ (DUF2303 family)
VVPEGGRLELIDIQAPRASHDPRPARMTGTVETDTAESFKAAVSEHASPCTTVWVDRDARRIVAVINDHGPDPEWGDHRVLLKLAHTPEWSHWAGLDGKLVDQLEFAEHIEDGVGEIVTPAAADMLEIAQSIHAHTQASFRSANRLHDGQVRVAYDETIDAKAGQSGDLSIPAEFELAVAPFVGGEPYRVRARLRYRVQGGTLRIGYKLDRPHVVVLDALDGITEDISGSFERVYQGRPRA